MSTIARNTNVGLDLSGKTAAIAGGTQGIGAATGLRFAQAGANVYIIGRNAELGQQVVEKMKNAGEAAEGRHFEFIQADLSSVKEVKRVAEELKVKAGAAGIDFLVQTQGGPPNGSYDLTSTTPAHESHFAVQTLSRFALAYFLASSSTLNRNAAWVNVLAPGGKDGPAPKIDDLELAAEEERKKGFFARVGAQMQQDGALADAMVSHFPRAFPSLSLRAYHLFPGYVHTSALRTSALLPSPLLLLQSLLGPLIARLLPAANTPESFADVPVYLAANVEAQERKAEGEVRFVGPTLKSVGKPAWAEEEDGVAKSVWEKLRKIVETEA
ncbi:hypothetical protein JCM11251_005921 [Rhodosporidiobolus azoricus]